MKKNDVLFLVVVLSFTVVSISIASPVPFDPSWSYDSSDGVDYRTFSGNDLSFNITSTETVAGTTPPINIPIENDFSISIDYANYAITGPNTNPGSWINTNAGINISWMTDQQDPIVGDYLTGNLSMWRGNMSINNSENYLSIYSLNNANYGSIESLDSVGTADQGGSLFINKSGNTVTSGFVDQAGNTYSWQYDISVFSISSDYFRIGISAQNGPYDSSSVLFSSFDVETASAPVPEPATMLLFVTGLVGLAGARFRRKKI